jgi:hypothetical protein
MKDKVLNLMDKLYASGIDGIRPTAYVLDDLEAISMFGDVTLANGGEFEVTFDGEQFKLKTTYSNQEITQEWMDIANELFNAVQDANN